MNRSFFKLCLLSLSCICSNVFSQSITLNPVDSVGISMKDNAGGLSVSRVALTALDNPSPLQSVKEGTLVYNTGENSVLAPGLYAWHEEAWAKIMWNPEDALPSGTIVERTAKSDMPGFSYLGSQYIDAYYSESIGEGFGSWNNLPAFPYAGNVEDPAFTTYNNNFFVWSGKDNSYLDYEQTGAYYNFSSEIWTPMNTTNAPAGRWGAATATNTTSGYFHVWGGVTSLIAAGTEPVLTNTGGTYDLLYPNSSWAPMPNSPLEARYKHTAVTAGGNQELFIVWGGSDADGLAFGDGAIFSLASYSWSMLPACPLSPRYGHSAVWTGTEMIVYGGTDGTLLYRDGASYNPSTNTWALIPEYLSNPSVYGHVAVWTGTEMIVMGGAYNIQGSIATNICSRYNPTSNTWSSAATAPGGGAYGHGAFYNQKAIWTGSQLIVGGGVNAANPGGAIAVRAYNASTDSWTLYNRTPRNLKAPAMGWDGESVLLQGGSLYSADFLKFDPDSGNPAHVELAIKRFFYKYIKD
ncbi:hypothetical protein LAG90_04870 [Marinilongibacter aquaticus]|uniref:Kelch repeat-containing protein n=1 Tax=Marinilongibacter aquaticus TaxID=2975157 RepID=UPI0021BD3A11|nr:hypothetical protein [Marinilongibacter aquaticus]UBM59981.1 hypothetical protein LAG90_04870 [Marinilongibacter aquaticus]